MNYVDAGVLAVVSVSALLGLARGLIREALGIAAWALAGWLTIRLFPIAQPFALRYINSPDLAQAAAIGGLFIAGLIVFSLLANLIGRVVRVSAIGGLDRLLGLVYGAARGAAIVIAAYIVGGMLMPPDRWPVEVLTAQSLPYVIESAKWAASQIPEAYRPAVQTPPAAKPDREPERPAADPGHAAKDQAHT